MKCRRGADHWVQTTKVSSKVHFSQDASAVEGVSREEMREETPSVRIKNRDGREEGKGENRVKGKGKIRQDRGERRDKME